MADYATVATILIVLASFGLIRNCYIFCFFFLEFRMLQPLSVTQSSEATSAERFGHEVESTSQHFAQVGDAMVQLQKNMVAELKQKESHIQSLKRQLNHAMEGRRKLQTELDEVNYQSHRAKQELSNAHGTIERLQRQVARLLEVGPTQILTHLLNVSGQPCYRAGCNVSVMLLFESLHVARLAACEH